MHNEHRRGNGKTPVPSSNKTFNCTSRCERCTQQIFACRSKLNRHIDPTQILDYVPISLFKFETKEVYIVTKFWQTVEV